MKKAIVLSLLAIAVYCSDAKAQSLPDYSQIKLETKADYNDAADSAALHSANYLLNKPFVKDDLDRLNTLQFLMKWMEGTPKYQFSIDESAGAFLEEPDNLGIYLAALVKVKMAQPTLADKQVGVAAVKQTLKYIANPKNQVKANKKVKALIDADKNGTLEEALSKPKQ